MLPCMGQRLAASPNRDISTNLTNGKVICRRSSPRIALERCLPRRPRTVQRKHSLPCPLWSRDVSKSNTYASSERRRCWLMALVSLVPQRKGKHTAQTHCVPAAKSQAEPSGIANVYSCCVPAAPFHYDLLSPARRLYTHATTSGLGLRRNRLG